MNANQLIRMLTRLMRVQNRHTGMGGNGAAMTPQDRARAQRKRGQVRGLRMGARLMRMFGRF
jgi:hypothetical protein